MQYNLSTHCVLWNIHPRLKFEIDMFPFALDVSFLKCKCNVLVGKLYKRRKLYLGYKFVG